MTMFNRKMWLKRYSDAQKHKCCANCAFYKRDYKCLKEPSSYITSTSQKTDCKDWYYFEKEPN